MINNEEVLEETINVLRNNGHLSKKVSAKLANDYIYSIVEDMELAFDLALSRIISENK